MRRRHEVMPDILLSLLLNVLLFNLVSAGGHSEHKHVIIHVPYKIKTIHHTHTITKHIHHGGDDKYEVLGYTMGHPSDLGGHGNDIGGGGHDFGGGGHDFGGGGHDFGGGGGGHLELSDGGHGGGGFDFGGGLGGGFGGGGGGGGHEDWSGR